MPYVQQVGDEFMTVKAESCEQPCSAQLAELKALTEACKLAEAKVANVDTNSAYAHRVCFFAAVWKQRGFGRTDAARTKVSNDAPLKIGNNKVSSPSEGQCRCYKR